MTSSTGKGPLMADAGASHSISIVAIVDGRSA